MDDIVDSIKRLFNTKRNKCKLILDDLLEELHKLEFNSKTELEKDLLDLSNIYRTWLENFITLLGKQ